MSDFFDEMTEASEIKSEIVSKYFNAWSKIMKNVPTVHKLGYIDLFSGAGRYKDGSPSTPIKVLESIIGDVDSRELFVTIFNDKDKDIAKTLKTEIKNLPDVDKLKYPPVVFNTEVDVSLMKKFKETSLIPNFAFVDPYGYKGLSLDLVESLMKDWGSDLVFFFNYNRISTGITNDKISMHIDRLFGEKRAKTIKEEVNKYKKNEKAHYIINELSEALFEKGCKFVIPFQFNKGNRISHYLIFVTKHFLGYSIMKEIMAKASSEHDDGVANFGYIPVENTQLELLFNYSRPLDELGDELLRLFEGQTLNTMEIYERHSIGTPFIKSNYKEALRRLEEEGSITVNPPARERRKSKGIVTFADKVSVTFPIYIK